MYDMYPYPDAITHRASEDELRWWQHQVVEVEILPEDLNDARNVAVAERATADANDIGFQIGSRLMKKTMELG